MDNGIVDIRSILDDPTQVQRTILGMIDTASDGNLYVKDATNPFTMLLEATSAIGASLKMENHVTTRSIYPNLASSPEEIFRHITDKEIEGMFAIPSEAPFIFYINLIDVRDNGIKITDGKYTMYKIPIYTEIVVGGYTFTLLNDIEVRLYDNGSVYAVQHNNDLDISISDLSILPCEKFNDADGKTWIVLETRIKQVYRSTINDVILDNNGYKKTLLLSSWYYYTDAMYVTPTGNIKFKKSLVEDYIDISTPTMYINSVDMSLYYRVPEVYSINLRYTGNIQIDTYETSGYINLPLSTYKVTDFSIILGKTTQDAASAVSRSVLMHVMSRGSSEGGKNGMSLEELKASIIYNSTGPVDVPVTFHNLMKYGSYNGFEITKALDVITSRVYVASKNLPESTDPLIHASPDIFCCTVNVSKDTYSNPYVIQNSDYIVVKSGAIFKEYNGVVTMASQEELNNINTSVGVDFITLLDNNKYFYTPYYYVIKKDDTVVTATVYDLDNPLITTYNIIDRNTSIPENANINRYGIFKTDTGYKLIIDLLANSYVTAFNVNDIKLQATFMLYGVDAKVSFLGVRNSDTGFYEFDINTNFFIDDDYIVINNGTSNIYSKLLPLIGDIYIHLFIENTSYTSTYLKSEIVTNSSSNYVVVSKDLLKYTLGTNLKYLWNRVRTTYSGRKFLTYTADVPMTYNSDVYEVFSNGTTIKIVNGSVVRNVLHRAGTAMLNTDGTPVIKHYKDDIVLDSNGVPVIDVDAGVERALDITLIELDFLYANSEVYNNYRKVFYNNINSWLTDDLAVMNKIVLENTVVQYKPLNTVNPVSVTVNKSTHYLPYFIVPDVILYTKGSTLSIEEIEQYSYTLGKIIHTFLDNSYLDISVLENRIKQFIGEKILGVKISSVDINDEARFITFTNKEDRLCLKKRLSINKSGEYIVSYAYNLIINQI